MKKIRVIELFAGVGGFRLGFEAASSEGSRYEVVWSNQWEPGSKTQHASEVYKARFGPIGHSSEDIEKVIKNSFEIIPEHDLLVGGFPCQDYSVARVLSQSKGLKGKKGVLWWSIHAILAGQGKKAPGFLMLENVDRLLKSPAKQRGRDFSIMLASLSDLGYAVEWRVINAADYGFPQRRRRVYILGYKKGTDSYKKVKGVNNPKEWITKEGVIAKAFPVLDGASSSEFEIKGSLDLLSKNFSKNKPGSSPFENSGIMINRKVVTIKTQAAYDGPRKVLKDIVIAEKLVPEEFFIKDKDLATWKYLKGGKKEKRKSKSGFEYTYSEGPIAFPDPLERPARTIVTGEGGTAPSRFKHVIKTASGRYRRLIPLELERIDMFPDNHTQGIPDVKRAFMMGNALVVGVIEKLGKSLADFLKAD